VTDLVELAHWGNPAFVKYAFVGKDQMLISAASSGVYYLNPETLSPIYFFDAKGRLSTLAVSIDGEWVATGDVNGDVAIWNLHDGTEISRFETGGGPIRSIAFSSDRLKLAAASTDRSISVWELENRIQLYKLMKHSMNINKIQFSPDGDYVISSGDDFHVLMWDMKTGELANDYLAAQKVNDLDISADAVTLVLAMNDATIEIWDLITGKKVNTISDPKIVTPFSYVKFLPNNQLILTGSADGYVRIWNTQSRGKIWETPTEQKGRAPVQTISVSNDGSRFVVTFKDGLSEIWSINSQTKEFSTQFNHAEVARFAISPNDQLLAVQYGSSSVELWSIANARKNIVLEGALPRGNTFALSSDKVLIDSGGLILYSLSNSTLNLDDFPKNGYVNYSQDDKTVIAASGGLINYWSVATGLELKPSKISNEGNCWVISRLDGSFLAAGSVNGVMISNSNLSYFCSVSRNPRTISEDILSDGSIIAFALENKLIEVWDSRSETKFTLTSQVPGDILDVAISKDRELLVSVSEGGIIEIYDLPNRKLIHTLDLHTGPVNQVLFSNDGKYLISGAADGIFRIFGLQP
jgi:WD40 repeat protein